MHFRAKILIIENDQRLVKSIKNFLILHGYEVCCADNGALGIQKAFEYNPDLILCAIKMDPIDGYQIYNTLKDSALIERIPFIFITTKSDLLDIRFGMDLGADDYFVKPFDNKILINSIEKRLTKFKKLKESGKCEFKALFNSTTNGVFLFDGHIILDANPALLKKLDLKKDNIISYSIGDFLDSHSFQKIKERIIRCTNGILNSFTETVFLIPRQGEKFEVNLHICVSEKYFTYSLMMGLVTLNNKKSDENQVFMGDVLKALKMENIDVPESLSEKLADVFKNRNIDVKTQKNDLFSDRENQVLRLSMEGLPIKIIADKLSIPDRTVEKHRAKLMEKSNSKNMIEVIVFALRNNLIDIKTIPFLSAFFGDSSGLF